MRFKIVYTADGGTFGRPCFRLSVVDKVSGAKADNLGNICTLEPFTIISKGCRYKCEFVKFIAAAGEEGEEEGCPCCDGAPSTRAHPQRPSPGAFLK